MYTWHHFVYFSVFVNIWIIILYQHNTSIGTFQLGIIQGTENCFERIYLYIKHTSEESYHVIFPLLICGVFIAKLNVVTLNENSICHKNTFIITWKTKKLDKRLIEDSVRQRQHTTADSRSGINDRSINSTTNHDDAMRVWACVQTLLACWLGYLLLWHTVFSNLPLHAAMPFAVHSRYDI